MTAVVEVHDLHKHYGKVHAVDGVSFTLEENRIYGLSTMRDRHVEVRGATMRFTFRGKGGKEHDIDVRDERRPERGRRPRRPGTHRPYRTRAPTRARPRRGGQRRLRPRGRRRPRSGR